LLQSEEELVHTVGIEVSRFILERGQCDRGLTIGELQSVEIGLEHGSRWRRFARQRDTRL
jgi:hypothetical protein